MYPVKTLYLLLILLTYGVAGAQTLPECDYMLKQVMEQTKNKRTAANNNGFDFDCQLVVKMESGHTESSRIALKTYQDKYVLANGDVIFYQDGNSSVVINNDTKAVFLTTPVPRQQRESQFSEMVNLQDTIIKLFRSTSCSKEWDTVLKGVGLQKIVLNPPDGKPNLGMQSVTLWIDPTKSEIRKILVQYQPDQPSGIRSYEMVVNKMVIGKILPFDGTALSKVFDGARLRTELSGFSVTDNR
jgi:hypothetical protein